MDGWMAQEQNSISLHQLLMRAHGAHSSLPLSDSPSGSLWSTTVGVFTPEKLQMLLIRILWSPQRANCLNIYPSTPLAEVLLYWKSSCSLAISCHFAIPSRGLSPLCPSPSPHTLGLSPFGQLLFQHFWCCFLQSAHFILVLSPCAFPIARTDTHTHTRGRSSWLGILKAHCKFWQKHRVLWQVLRHKSQKFLDSYPQHSIIWNFPKENHENWCSFSFSLDFFLDTFLSLHRPERNTIYITDVFKDAGTNMKLVAQTRENNSVLAGGSPRVHDHIGVQFITLSLEKLFILVQPDV